MLGVVIQTIVMVAYYLIVAFFLIAIVRNFVRSRNAQHAILYGVMMVPFVLRLLRLK